MTALLPPGDTESMLEAWASQKLLPQPGTPWHEYLLDVATNEWIKAILAHHGFEDGEDDDITGE